MIKASNGDLKKNILGINEHPLVSKDFNHDSRSSIFDITQPKLLKKNSVNSFLV